MKKQTKIMSKMAIATFAVGTAISVPLVMTNCCAKNKHGIGNLDVDLPSFENKAGSAWAAGINNGWKISGLDSDTFKKPKNFKSGYAFATGNLIKPDGITSLAFIMFGEFDYSSSWTFTSATRTPSAPTAGTYTFKWAGTIGYFDSSLNQHQLTTNEGLAPDIRIL